VPTDEAHSSEKARVGGVHAERMVSPTLLVRQWRSTVVDASGRTGSDSYHSGRLVGCRGGSTEPRLEPTETRG
jgi:hypothetical protein